MQKRISAKISVSATTRLPGKGELDGVNYNFMSKEDFEQGIQEHQFLEYAQVFGNYYGTPKQNVQKLLDNGEIVLLEIDVQGALQVKKIYSDVITIFVLPPDPKCLKERMNNRARDDGENDEFRIQQASQEIAAAWQHYDNMVINDDLEQAVQEIIDIIESGEH